MTILLMPRKEFIGGIEMEMGRVVKSFMFKSRYRLVQRTVKIR